MTTGRVTTFYSYKGGVGRTFLLANVGWLLGRWGRKVLCLDWDLEAPGLFRYLAPDAPPRAGVLDLVQGLVEPEPMPWRSAVGAVSGPWTGEGRLDLLGAGRRDDTFVRAVQELRWDELSARGLEPALERVRAEWVAEYDHVLIDSRTGITDVGGICAAQLPDLLVLVFTATYQSLEGAIDVADRARKARSSLPLDRGGFHVLPIPSRLHTGEEELLDEEWTRRFADQLEPLYAPWKDGGVATHEYIAHLRVREQARWSFGEQLPVRQEALDDPNRISYTFANIAALVDRQLEDSGGVIRSRHDYVAQLAGEAGLAQSEMAADARYDVFISYPHAHRPEVEVLSAALRTRGMRVYYDRDVRLGENWGEALYRARERSRMFLVLVPEGPLGPGQMDELLHVYRRYTQGNVSVVPVFLERVPDRSFAPVWLLHLLGLSLREDGGWEGIADRVARQFRRS